MKQKTVSHDALTLTVAALGFILDISARTCIKCEKLWSLFTLSGMESSAGPGRLSEARRI